MNENDVIEIVRDFISRQFPRKCECCGKNYRSFAEFIRSTTHVGKPVSYDTDPLSWELYHPVGTIGMVNCSCDTTLAISSSGMDLKTLWRLMNWGRKEAKKRGLKISDLLENLRNKMEKRVLQDENRQIKTAKSLTLTSTSSAGR